MHKYIILSFLLFAALLSQAQKKVSISGTVTGINSGETLIGASVRVAGIKNSGTITNSYGFYSLSVVPGEYTFIFSYVGYEEGTKRIKVLRDTTLGVALAIKTNLSEVVVHASTQKDIVSSPQMGLIQMDMKQANMVPVIMGERDVLKTISLMPGVKSAGEGNAGFYVRGGASDQNLILLDGAPIYNAAHLFGFFSVFNSDAIKDVSLYKGGMPAQYGGRLSSVLDIKMNDGNNQKTTLEGGLGLIASRLKLEGPIVKNKGSFMLSGRRTYADLFLKLSSDTAVKKSSLYFYDLNVKANYKFNDKNGIYFSGYYGKDQMGVRDLFGLHWSNVAGTFRYNHIFNSRLFSNTYFIYNNYNYTVEQLKNGNEFNLTSKIEDLSFKQDLEYKLNSSHSFKLGASVIHHKIAPGDISSTDSSSFNDQHVQRRYGFETAAYLSDQWKATDRLNVLAGIRLSDMFIVGPGTFTKYNPDGSTISSKDYTSGQLVKSYLNLEPRLSASYRLNDFSSIKLSYNRNTQNIHLLSNSTSSSPNDLYVMSSENIQPEIADQISTGYFRKFKNGQFEFSAELYYKWLQNQIDYKDGAEFIANKEVESQLTYGDGRAYGLELFLKKKYGRLNGWIGYTLSRTERSFAAINHGKYYPARQDRTHDLSIVGIYKLNKRWSFSASFIYGTGNAVSYPTGKYSIGGNTTYSYSERNGYRLPATNRLDIGATLEGKKHKNYQTSWTFSIYNVYASHDPYIITFRDSKTKPNTTEAVETSLFPVPIPSITWNFKF